MKKDEDTVKQGADIRRQEKMENGINVVLVWSLEDSGASLSSKIMARKGTVHWLPQRTCSFPGQGQSVQALGWRWWTLFKHLPDNLSEISKKVKLRMWTGLLQQAYLNLDYVYSGA